MAESGQRRALEAMKKIEAVFHSLERSADKGGQYMEQAISEDGQERKRTIDALRMAVIQMGEAVARMERLQPNFWEEYTGTVFPKAKKVRNRLAHTEEMSDTDIVKWADKNLRTIRTAVARTVFGKLKAGRQRVWTLDLTKANELPLSEEDEPATEGNSVALIYWDSFEEKYLIMRAQSRS